MFAEDTKHRRTRKETLTTRIIMAPYDNTATVIHDDKMMLIDDNQKPAINPKKVAFVEVPQVRMVEHKRDLSSEEFESYWLIRKDMIRIRNENVEAYIEIVQGRDKDEASRRGLEVYFRELCKKRKIAIRIVRSMVFQEQANQDMSDDEPDIAYLAKVYSKASEEAKQIAYATGLEDRRVASLQ